MVEGENVAINNNAYVSVDGYTKNAWEPTQRSFAGVDILATAYVEGRLVVCDNISTISYATHREKVNVPTLGRSYARRRTRGMRTIAGTIIWIVKDRAPLWRFLGHYKYDKNAVMHLPMSDSMPPFDITLTYANEYGHVSVMRIYGIDITDEGQTHSIQDMITENVMQYQAFDMDVMMPIDAENGELPWIQAKDGTFYRAIGNLTTPATEAPGYNEYTKYQRLVSWLGIFISDYDRQTYAFYDTSRTQDPTQYVLIAPTEVEAIFKEVNISIQSCVYGTLTQLLTSVRNQMTELRSKFGLYWNVEEMRQQISDGTIVSASPFDQSTYTNW